MKNRKTKHLEYEKKYSDLSKDDNMRLHNLLKEYKYYDNTKKMNSLHARRDAISEYSKFKEIHIILYEEPEGAKRPRFRLINRKNIGNSSLAANQFIHVYSPNASGDNSYMKKLTETEINDLQQLIYTPCTLEIDVYIKIPTAFNQQDTVLSEMGYIRPVCKPDWDNIGKKYCDMLNGNIIYDDSYVISGTVNKYYSLLPRVEIRVSYLNKLYNKYQYDRIKHKLNENETVEYF